MSVSPSFRRFTIWCTALTFALIVVGGVVRTTASGDACPDWPLCYGQIIPPFQLRIWIEWTHRLVTSLVYTSVLALVIWVSLRYRADRLIFRGAWLAFFLLIFQIVLGGLVVILQLPPALVGIHLANALLIFATLIAVSLTASASPHGSRIAVPASTNPQGSSIAVPKAGSFVPASTNPQGSSIAVPKAGSFVPASTNPQGSSIAVPKAGSFGPAAGSFGPSDPRLRRLIVLSAAAVYVLIFSGSVVVGAGSSGDCAGWPLCNGGILPAGVGEAINLTHRYFAAAVGILLFYTLSETLRRHRANRPLRRAAHTAVGLFGVEIVIGGINVLTQFTPFWNSLHLAAATAVWGAMFAFALIGIRVLGGSTAAAQTTQEMDPNAQPYPPPVSGR
jgi:heme A synthase